MLRDSLSSRGRLEQSLGSLKDGEEGRKAEKLWIGGQQSRDIVQGLKGIRYNQHPQWQEQRAHTPVIIRSPSALDKSSVSNNLSAFACVNADFR